MLLESPCQSFAFKSQCNRCFLSAAPPMAIFRALHAELAMVGRGVTFGKTGEKLAWYDFGEFGEFTQRT